jgi:integrase
MEVVFFMLKEAGIVEPSKLVTVPDFHDEDDEAVPYTKEDLRKLFDVMDEDEKFLFTFFLDSAARKGEVAHATWNDIYDGKFHIRAKAYKNAKGEAKMFTVKITNEPWSLMMRVSEPTRPLSGADGEVLSKRD